MVSTNVETENPEAEIQPGINLLGPIKQKFLLVRYLMIFSVATFGFCLYFLSGSKFIQVLEKQIYFKLLIYMFFLYYVSFDSGRSNMQNRPKNEHVAAAIFSERFSGFLKD